MYADPVARVARGRRLAWLWLIAIVMHPGLSEVSHAADNPPARPEVDGDGVAHIPALTVPASTYMSRESRRKFIKQFSSPPPGPGKGADVRALRDYDERKNAPFVARAQALYPVTIEAKVIGGVRTQVITPKAGVAPNNRSRVLINLHGGGFLWGEGNGAKTESIPIAGVGKITVISIAYRQAPEFKFPAASEDVASVYRELLKDHRAVDIGIYGCSAGGILAAEAIVWFQQHKLPMPGAIGTFCGSAVALGGDSSHLASLLVGEMPSASADSGSLSFLDYFSETAPSDPLVLPSASEQVLARFPPTLLIAGSRDFTVSSLFRTQAVLTNAGVEAELHVWDGMWHAFFMDPDLPESQEVYRVVVRFFDRHLGRAPGATTSR